jgi:Rod binding domain-containing protein
MNASTIAVAAPVQTTASLLNSASKPAGMAPVDGKDNSAVRKAFDQFVGETFFSQMLKSMRSMTDKPAYFHGGRGEEVFQGQLDQMLAEKMTEKSADTFTGPMFELFSLQRR